MCGQALAWVTSENSTSTGMPTSFDSIFFAVAGPSLLCYCLRSPVLTAPVRGSTTTLCCPVANCSRLGPVVNSHSGPLTTSGYGEISGPKILYLVSRQNRQRNHLLWRATHIVLQNFFLVPGSQSFQACLNCTSCQRPLWEIVIFVFAYFISCLFYFYLLFFIFISFPYSYMGCGLSLCDIFKKIIHHPSSVDIFFKNDNDFRQLFVESMTKHYLVTTDAICITLPNIKRS